MMDIPKPSLPDRVKTIHLIFFDAGGGHRSAANALRQVIEQQQCPWKVEMLNLQELFDPIDRLLRLTGMRSQDLYNFSLKHGYTLGWPQLTRAMQKLIRRYHPEQVQLLRRYWAIHDSDLVVSLIPNFNRAIFGSLKYLARPVPMMTVMTDLADYPPQFWMVQQQQYLVCGTDMAVKQAREQGHAENRVLRTSGMILNPRFYEPVLHDRGVERRRLGLDPKLPTGLVMFGGHGSSDMEDIVDSLNRAAPRLQLIMICGHNDKLANRLRQMPSVFPKYVEGFTREIPYFMHLSDFFIGKPGPGSISEALAMKLPVIVERNVWTLPQERYNTEWIEEQGFGIVLKSFDKLDLAIEQMLHPPTYRELRQRVSAYRNRAVFEIPAIMEQVLNESEAAPQWPALITGASSAAI